MAKANKSHKISAKPPNARAQAIRELEDRFGRVTPQIVLEAAKNPKHVLHREFEWDNGKAAHRYRLDQARTIIASIRIVVETNNKQFVGIGYVRDIKAGQESGYIATRVLRTEEEAARDTLQFEVDRIQAILDRVREVAVTLSLEAEFQKALTAVVELNTRLRRGRPAHRDHATSATI